MTLEFLRRALAWVEYEEFIAEEGHATDAYHL